MYTPHTNSNDSCDRENAKFYFLAVKEKKVVFIHSVEFNQVQCYFLHLALTKTRATRQLVNCLLKCIMHGIHEPHPSSYYFKKKLAPI